MQYTNAKWRRDGGSSLNAALCRQQFHLSSARIPELGLPRTSILDGRTALGHMCVTLTPLPVHPCRFSWKLHKIVFRFVSVLRSRFFHWKCAFKIYCSHKHKINCISVGGNSSWTGQGTVHRRLLTIEITICWEMKSAGDWTPNSIEFAAWPTFCKHLLVGQRTLLSVFCFPKIVKSSLMCAIIVLQQQNSCSPCSWVLRLCSDFCHNVLGLLKYFIESF